MKNWRLIENPNLDKGMVFDFYESSEVNEILNDKDREISRLKKLNKKMSCELNENIAQIVDWNANYWKELCEKRTKMYLEEQARANALGEQLQKEIHKPFPYIEKVNRMRIALLREMAKRAFFEARYLNSLPKEFINENMRNQHRRRCRQWSLFNRKADELEKELEND